MPMSRSNPKILKKKPPAKKPLKVALSKPSGTTAKVSGAVPSPVAETLELLERYYPEAHCALFFETPFQLLIATILSAQCTDERVNKVTPALFQKYPDAPSMARAPIGKIEELIRSTGFFKNKARNIKNCAQSLVKDHQGEVPKDLNSLVALDGVGRKTANVVLGNAFGIISGIVVDTHVTRLSQRLGWTKSGSGAGAKGGNAVVIERDLQKIIPKEKWIELSHWLITHGRKVCQARKPLCESCFLFELCPKIIKIR